MKLIVKGLAILAFLAVAAYGLTRFLEAQTARHVLADAEQFCSGRGGIDRIEAEAGMILSATCSNGEVFRPDAENAIRPG